MYGCTEDSASGITWKCGDYEITRCPVAVVDVNIYEWMRAYWRYEKGMLPNAGGWADQSDKFIQMITLAESIASEVKQNARQQSKTRNTIKSTRRSY